MKLPPLVALYFNMQKNDDDDCQIDSRNNKECFYLLAHYDYQKHDVN